jgi:hypothetical protein
MKASDFKKGMLVEILNKRTGDTLEGWKSTNKLHFIGAIGTIDMVHPSHLDISFDNGESGSWDFLFEDVGLIDENEAAFQKYKMEV